MPTRLNFLRAPLDFLRLLIAHGDLIRQMLLREVSLKYKGSLLGRPWIVIQPLLMLALYTYVFSFVFQAKWKSLAAGSPVNMHANFALLLFSSLLVYGVFGESINRAPTAIISNPNFVKKVVFPIELLGVVQVLASLVQCLVGFLILLVAYILVLGEFPTRLLLLPLVLLPLTLFVFGITWILNALGVFFRDIVNLTPSLVTLMMFITPVFYDVEAVPEKFRFVVTLNPMAYFVGFARALVDSSAQLDWTSWGIYSAVSILTAWIGFAFFRRVKVGFADVL